MRSDKYKKKSSKITNKNKYKSRNRNEDLDFENLYSLDSNGRSKKKYKKKKMKTWKKVLIAIFAILLILFAGFWIYINLLLGSTQKEEISTSDEDLGITVDATEGVENFVFYGIDSSDGVSGRSDAIMVVTIDFNNKKIKLSSVARDSYVNISGYGMDKINHAYSYGGPQLAVQTLNSNFGLDVRSYATVDFDSLPEIVDALGGVDITVTDTEAASGQISGIYSAGTYTLTGSQALSFSRIRSTDNDFERGRRQRDVMQALITKMMNQNPTAYPGILSTILPLTTTNMDAGDILSLGTSVVTQGVSNIEQMRLPFEDLGYGQTINGVYYYVFDIETNKSRLYDYIYNDISQ